MLEHMIETCKGNGDVVVMGDLNAHLGIGKQVPGAGVTQPDTGKLSKHCANNTPWK